MLTLDRCVEALRQHRVRPYLVRGVHGLPIAAAQRRQHNAVLASGASVGPLLELHDHGGLSVAGRAQRDVDAF
jgi:hypothetical protein